MKSSDSFYVRAGKRCFDLLGASVGILILSPVFFVLCMGVLFTSGTPIFFRQRRTGSQGRPFLIWKFRTMIAASEEKGPLLTAADDARITPFGRWLRRTKADELPQLLNVLLGDMSLVGPRPEVPRYTEKYSPRQKAVLDVRPGITGPTANTYIVEEELLAQVSDKEEFYLTVLLPEKIESDLRYIQSISFNTDLKLIANTLTRLLFKSQNNRKLISPASERECRECRRLKSGNAQEVHLGFRKKA